MVVVLSEASFHDVSTRNGRELQSITETARLFGCRIYPLPPDFSQCETAENALAYVPTFTPPIPAVWVGYIPSVERYDAVYRAAQAKGVLLINTPDQYQTAMEFDRFYPLIADLTPRSITLNSIEECDTVGAQLGYPLFVKGAVKSNKEKGWQACVAGNAEELRALVTNLLEREARSRGRVIVRQLARLRVIGNDGGNFPLGREYRVFLYQNEVLACGFYWEGLCYASDLTAAEENAVLQLAQEASHRVGTPFIAVDVGQLETGDWTVIEVGDAQFTGLSQVSVLKLWSNLHRMLGYENRVVLTE